MTTVLFDLDGTITQPASGIISSFIHALRELNRPVPDKSSLTWIIGPALRESFSKFISDRAEVEKAIALYRDYYTRQGIFDASVFSGIPETLRGLKQDGYNLMVCTAKPRPFAERILDHFGIKDFFSAVYGPDFDGHMDNKAELLNLIIAERQLTPRHCCLIGDRCYDATAAIQNNVIPIGALWGFGSHEELQQAGAKYFCAAPADIPAVVASL